MFGIEELIAIVERLRSADYAFRDQNLFIGVWDEMQPLTKNKKIEHRTRINSALITRASSDTAALADLDAWIAAQILLPILIPSATLLPSTSLLPIS